MEKDNQKKRESFKHFSHEHPLVWNEDAEAMSDEDEEARCRGCLEPILGPSFSCGKCKFQLHKTCAEAPSKITHSPFPCKRPTLTLTRLEDSYCHLCCEVFREMFFYSCSSCTTTLDIKCAFLLHYNTDENLPHEHPLTYILDRNYQLQIAHCYCCQKPLLDYPVYVCFPCKFYLHEECAQFPQLTHPSHRKHTLYIDDAKLELTCSLCQQSQWSLFYRCLPCNFNIDIKCVLSKPSSIKYKNDYHEHSFSLFFKYGSFVCDACGIEGNSISYICSTCHIMIHDKCKSLPRIVKTTRHDHCIVHNYFFQKKKLESHDCGICLSEVKSEYGSYTCFNRYCNYVAHVNCALEMGMYDAIDEGENLFVIERNEDFSHEHDLTLSHIFKEDEDKYCDGCRLTISSSFYYCSQCDFLLHDTCVKLRRKGKHRGLHGSLTTLKSMNYFVCLMCRLLCSGFCYKRYKSDEKDCFCLRCCGISLNYSLERERNGHKHSFFHDSNFQGKCNACGLTSLGVYRCKDCTFVVDFRCMTTPQETRHNCDEHFLKLTYFHGDDQIDDVEQHYGDICEEERDSTYWFYHCTICDTSAHLQCALENFPFYKIKIGATLPHYYSCEFHEHALTFVKMVYDKCSFCGRPCRDVALQCTQSGCKYISHLNCWTQFAYR